MVCLKSSFNSLQIEWESLVFCDHMRAWKLSTKYLAVSRAALFSYDFTAYKFVFKGRLGVGQAGSWRCTAQPIVVFPHSKKSGGFLAGLIMSPYVSTNGKAPQWLDHFVIFWFWSPRADLLNVGAWPIRIHPGMTNQEPVCFHQWGGHPVITSFCQILIWKSVGWDLGWQSSTSQKAIWLGQSEASVFHQWGGSPEIISFSWIWIWSFLGWDIGFGSWGWDCVWWGDLVMKTVIVRQAKKLKDLAVQK